MKQENTKVEVRQGTLLTTQPFIEQLNAQMDHAFHTLRIISIWAQLVFNNEYGYPMQKGPQNTGQCARITVNNTFSFLTLLHHFYIQMENSLSYSQVHETRSEETKQPEHFSLRVLRPLPFILTLRIRLLSMRRLPSSVTLTGNWTF